MTTTDLKITGMTCGHCVASVQEELGEIAGVTAVDVDLAAELLLDLRLVDEVRERPLDAGHDRLGARPEKLPHEVRLLVVRQSSPDAPVVVAGNMQVQQRVDEWPDPAAAVIATIAAPHGHGLSPPPPFHDERKEELRHAAADGEEAPPPSPVKQPRRPRGG